MVGPREIFSNIKKIIDFQDNFFNIIFINYSLHIFINYYEML